MDGRSTVLALTAATVGVTLRTVSGGGGRVSRTSTDVAWMQEACKQAQQSVPVESAYCVGCVLVKNGKVRPQIETAHGCDN